jgi:hypothetical protein
LKAEFFNDAFFDSLPDDDLLCLSVICQEFRKLDRSASGKPEFHEDFLNALAVFKAYAELKKFPTDPPPPGADAGRNMQNIRDFFTRNEEIVIRRLNTEYVERQTRKHADRFASESAYSFSDEDYSRIQTLINEIRDLIVATEVIAPRHKQRLLERLERLQQELHKTTSDLDRFWGFIGEAGVVLGKFGKDIKPLVDRVRELAEIVWKTIGAKEKLLDNSNPILIPSSDQPNDKTVAT